MITAHSFDFNTGTLRPIADAGTLPRGSKLYYEDMANAPKDFVVLDSEFTCSHGQKAISEFGHFSYPSKDAVESPGGWKYCMEDGKPIVLTEEEVREFVANAEARGIALERQEREAAEKKAIAREELKKEHTAKYGALLTALADSKRSASATAAANLKKLLSKTFPGVKFSVKSDYNSIRAYWENGPMPSCAKMEEIEALFNTGAFDPYLDYHYSIENVFADIFGGANYVSFQREITGDKYLETASELGIEGVRVVEYNNLEGCGYSERELIYSKTREKNFAEAVELKPIKGRSVPAATNCNEIEVNENKEKNGIEIRFPGKPSEEVRSALKSNGFRWSRRGGFWFNKHSPEAFQFAQALAG